MENIMFTVFGMMGYIMLLKIDRIIKQLQQPKRKMKQVKTYLYILYN
jgi:hypothetical protein